MQGPMEARCGANRDPLSYHQSSCHAPGAGHTSSQVLSTTLLDKLCSSFKKGQKEDTGRLAGSRGHSLRSGPGMSQTPLPKNNWQESLNKERPEVHTPKGENNKNSDRVGMVGRIY